MKTLTLDELVEKPAAAKKLVAKWGGVQIIEKGRPLWKLIPAGKNEQASSDDEDEAWWTAYFAELQSESPRKGKSAARVLLEARGKA